MKLRIENIYQLKETKMQIAKHHLNTEQREEENTIFFS